MVLHSTIGFADQSIGNQLNNYNIKCINVGDNLKINSKILGVLLALLATAMVISAASAVDLANDFNNDGFAMNVASGTNFTQTVNVSTGDISLVIFENSATNAGDANSVIYFKDFTADKKEIAGFINDLEKDGNKVEETDKYVVLENTKNFNGFDIGNVDDIFNFVGSIFSDEGLNVSADGNSISLSKNGLEVFDNSGENVSISADGVSVSSPSDNETVDVSSDVGSNIEDSDYSVYLKGNDDKVIVISGNNLELLKSMAETVSFDDN